MQSALLIVSLLIAGFGIIYFLLARLVRRLMDPQALLEQLRAEVQALVVELNQTTERDVSLVEDRLKALTEAVKRAERTIRLLRGVTERASRDQEVFAVLDRAAALQSVAAPNPPAAAPPLGHASPDVEGGEAGDAPALEHPGEGQGARVTPQPDVRERVLSLHRAGMSVQSICRRLRVSRGRVELIVALGEGPRATGAEATGREAEEAPPDGPGRWAPGSGRSGSE